MRRAKGCPAQIAKGAAPAEPLYRPRHQPSEQPCSPPSSPSCSRSCGPPPMWRPRSGSPTSPPMRSWRCGSRIAAGAAVVMVLALRRPWEPVARRWPHLLIGGALAHGLALATAHKALISVAATPTALVHAFHPILTAALGVFLLGETFPGGNGSASRSGSPASCSACRTMPTSASGAAGLEPVRPLRRHALSEELRRRRAAVRGDRRAADRRRAAGDRA